MPPIVTAEQANQLTEPFHALWVGSYRQAEKQIQRLREFDPEAFLAYEPRTIAGMMRDHVVRGVRHGSGVVSTEALGTFTQIINGKTASVLVRFKELDTELKRFNHTSGRQNALDRQMFDPDDYGRMTNDGLERVPSLITCGYVRDFDIVNISRIVVVLHWGRDPLWQYDLEEGTMKEIVQFPSFEPPQSTVGSRIKKDAQATEAE